MSAGVDALQHLARPAAGEAEGALVLLHGRGADEHDLWPLLDLLDPRRRLDAYTPGGPLHLPPGGRHWYVSRQVGHPDPQTFRDSLALIGEFLDGLGVPPNRIVLGGFSQGTVMSYAAGLGEGRPRPAALLALSGFLPTVPGFELDLAGAAGLPVAIGHGSLDPVIPVDFGRDARRRLEEAGADVVYHEVAMGHGIDPRFLATLPAFVERALSRTAG